MKYLGSNLVVKWKFLNLCHALYKNTNGNTKLYEYISRCATADLRDIKCRKADAVGLIMTDKTGEKILLNKEFRLSVNEWVYNFPGGLVDAGESVCEAAKRELKEETGLDLVSVNKVLGKAVTAVGLSDETVMTVVGVADGCISQAGTEEFEEIETNWYSKEEVRELLKKNELMSLRTQGYLSLWSNYIF